MTVTAIAPSGVNNFYWAGTGDQTLLGHGGHDDLNGGPGDDGDILIG